MVESTWAKETLHDMRFQLSLCVLVALCSVCDQRPPVVGQASARVGVAQSAADSDDEMPKAAAIPRDRLLASSLASRGSIVEYTYKSLSSYRDNSEMAADGEGGDWTSRNADLFPEMLVAIPATLQPDEDFPFGDMTDCALIEPSSLLMVSCSSESWTEVLPDKFPDALHYLRIMRTGISRLNGDAFGGKDILVLEITGHVEHILEITEESFADLTGIQQLIIHNNNLGVSHGNGFFTTFTHLDRLDVLDLDYNGLHFNGSGSDPDPDSDPVLTSVRHLSLRGNPMEKIDDYFFWDLRESPLISLNLQSCNISWFGARAFEDLKQLEQVDFYDNPLFMPDTRPPSIETFVDMRPFAEAMGSMNEEKFRSLGLAGTGLVRVPTEVFATRTLALTSLNLSENHITDIGILAKALGLDAFPVMGNLTDISLRANGISEIHENTFKNLKLEFLDVSRNKFTSLTNGVLHSNLLYLDISYQCTICEGIPFFTINPNKFLDNNMRQLRVLKMSGLRIDGADNETFTGLTGLGELFMDNLNSHVLRISAGTFRDLNKLDRLDMSNNGQLLPLPQWAFEGLDELKVLNLENSKRAIRNVNRVGTGSYPLGGLGKLRHLKLRSAVEYENQSLYTQPLSQALLEQLPSIEILDLSSNNIHLWTEVDVFSHNKNLSVLYLQSNDINSLTEPMISSFRKLKILDLSENIITCDANVEAFYHMAKETPGLEVVGYDDGRGYKCLIEDGEYLTFEEYVLSIPEPPKFDELHLGIFVGVLVTLTVFIMVGFYVFRKRYYLSHYVSRRGRRRDKCDDERANREYDYDVFISYHEEESEWVYEELLPELEETEPKIRACVRERDFKVRHSGDRIPNGHGYHKYGFSFALFM